VITDLFVTTSGIDDTTVARAIPPACRREPSAPAAVRRAADELVLELPEWRPRVPARCFVPSISMLADAVYAARFELSARLDGRWSPWIATATLGPAVFSPLASRCDGLQCDVDAYAADVACEAVRLRVRLGTADPRTLAAAPWLVTLSASDLAPPRAAPLAAEATRLAVPALCQLEAPPEIALRICSPTSVAMVLSYWGSPAAVVPLAEELFHPDTERYGVWPAAIKAAGRRGVAGYLLRFPDWPSAAWCLAHGLPIIASIRYTDGELTDAAIRETSGHLIVLTGCDREHVFVNDPVAPTPADVPRRYRLDELQRVWLERTGIGYVLFRPGAIS
jgi:uncharacterized protein YvpB